MANLTPVNSFDNVIQLETNTVALGGVGGIMNAQAQALLNRTTYLNSALANKLDASSTTDTVTEGSTNLYFTDARVRNTVLTGLSLVTNAAISASDTVLSALGKLQKQITDILTNQRYAFNEQSGTAYTVVAGDVTPTGRVIVKCTNAAAIAVTIATPSSLGVSTGNSVNIRQGGTGVVTISGALEGNGVFTAQHETKTLIAQAANTWLVVGG